MKDAPPKPIPTGEIRLGQILRSLELSDSFEGEPGLVSLADDGFPVSLEPAPFQIINRHAQRRRRRRRRG